MTIGRHACRSLRALPLLALAALIGCSESAGPTAPPEISAGRRAASTLGDGACTTEIAGAASALPAKTIRFAAWAPPLASYDTSFLLTVGRRATFTVPFVGWSLPFLKLEIPQDGDFFDTAGSELRSGDTVRITVKIDRVNAAVSFGPHGSVFMGAKPAQLYLNYWFLDLGGRMPTHLRVWYQPQSGAVWSPQTTTVDVQFWWLITPIYHFSNYAVAY